MRAGVYALLILCRIVRKDSCPKASLGRKKTAGSLLFKRLKRWDKSPPTISTNHYNKLLSIGTERHMGRSLQYSALHECRDSACWRPFGVRLRGSSPFYRLFFDICAAPLRMTRGVWRSVRCNPFVAMLL